MGTDQPIPCEGRTAQTVPLMTSKVPAGFPSPADDYLERPLDFNELLIAHPAATFAVRIQGDSMVGLGIFPGDIAVVDRAETATDGRIILALLDGQFTVKTFRRSGPKIWLEAANPTYRVMPITEDTNFEVWGVVRHSIRMLAHGPVR